MFLKPIEFKKKYEDIITSQISVWMWTNIFQECFNILKPDFVENSDDVIRQALLQGSLWYEKNAFYSKGRFTNKQALELERMGAKYSSFRNAYLIDKSKLPTNITWAIDTVKTRSVAKATAIGVYLTYQLGILPDLLNKISFDISAEKIFQNLQKRLYQNADKQKFKLIYPKLDKIILEDFAQNYINNLNFWIKNWTETEIIKMREVVGQMALKGSSYLSIADYIKKEFGTGQKKARFLARNETSIATQSFLNARYQAEGFVKFKWVHTNRSKEPRPYHKNVLNGQIFRYDDPPIIEEGTIKRGLPSQTYNCMCEASPYADKEFFENRKKMFLNK